MNKNSTGEARTKFYESMFSCALIFFFQAEDGIRDLTVTGVQTCALPICLRRLQNATPPGRIVKVKYLENRTSGRLSTVPPRTDGIARPLGCRNARHTGAPDRKSVV